MLVCIYIILILINIFILLLFLYICTYSRTLVKHKDIISSEIVKYVYIDFKLTFQASLNSRPEIYFIKF